VAPNTHVGAALRQLREELAEREAQAAKLRKAITGLEELLPPSNISRVTLEIVNPATETRSTVAVQPATPPGVESIARRPLLRDGIPQVLRVNPAGLTIRAIADELFRLNWLGGTHDDSRAEMVREALRALKRVGIVESEVPDGAKAAIWRLSNVLLPRPPTYTSAEEESGI
jgi:hypothetical protein